MRKFIFCSLVCFLSFSFSACKGDTGSSGNAASTFSGGAGKPTDPSTNPDPVEADGIRVKASGEDYPAENTLDGSLDPESRWSANGDDEWIEYDLGGNYLVRGLEIAFLDSRSRTQRFTIQLRNSGGDWIKVFEGQNRSNEPEFQHFGFYPRKARYVRITGNGGESGGDRSTTLVEMMPVYDSERIMPKASYRRTYHVSPKGDGDGSESAPLGSIQEALKLAQPGDRVLLAAGRYMEDISSVRSGTKDHPITIQGPKGAILQGDGGGRVFEIHHDYIRLLGFTMDGLVGKGTSRNDYREKLLYVQGENTHRGPEGLMIHGMSFRNAGGECLRLRYFIRNADVGFNRFENCGVHDFKFGGKKNGEAIYLGTSSMQWEDGKNPTGGPDISTNNRIHHNYFNTQGNECVDIKEGSVKNLVEYNYCTGQQDPNSGGFDSRSDDNTFRYNVSVGNRGAGVRIGGHEVDGHTYGTHNHVYGNVLQENAGGTLKLLTPGQSHLCENTVMGSKGRSASGYDGDLTESCKF
ncbi:MAG TPA: discoidin domain-containing protein [Gammaproteobacteria bacterium]|nr:discoidin domain-containing protein [Gammaproteobacteria bacterium]